MPCAADGHLCILSPLAYPRKQMSSAAQEEGAYVRCASWIVVTQPYQPMASASGNVNQKVEPLPATLSTPTCPPCRSTTVLQMYRPSPRLSLVSPCAATPCARWNGSHPRSRSSR